MLQHLDMTSFVTTKRTENPQTNRLIDQFPLVEEVVTAFNIPIIKQVGFEADDILGTVSKMVEKKANGKLKIWNFTY